MGDASDDLRLFVCLLPAYLQEMMKEAGLMASVEHEHLLPLVGVCVAKGGLKIVTILRPLGSLLKFLAEHKTNLCAKQMVLYCYQISSVSVVVCMKI